MECIDKTGRGKGGEDEKAGGSWRWIILAEV